MVATGGSRWLDLAPTAGLRPPMTSVIVVGSLRAAGREEDFDDRCLRATEHIRQGGCRASDRGRAVARGQGGAGRGAAVGASRSGSRRRTGRARSSSWRSRRKRGCRSWCRSATGGCSSRRSRSTVAPHYLMASDLAGMPWTGLRAQLCGDAHLSNFGAFAAPGAAARVRHQRLRRDAPGPFEWDVKRLAASFAVAGRERGFDDKQRETVNLAVGAAYREAMAGYAAMGNLDLWYSRVDVEEAVRRVRSSVATAKERKRAEKNLAKTRTKDSLKAFEKLTEIVDGEPRIISDPPRRRCRSTELARRGALRRARGVPAQCHPLLPADAGRTIAAVCSSATASSTRPARSSASAASARAPASCSCSARDDSDPLFLQFKEAEASVLEPFVGKSEFANHGQRVVEGQRLMQAASDIMLGWTAPTASTASTRDFYVRQLWDCEGLGPRRADGARRAAASTRASAAAELARAHARSGDAVAIASYLGTGDTFDRALAPFAETYADQNEKDYRRTQASRRIRAGHGADRTVSQRPRRRRLVRGVVL